MRSNKYLQKSMFYVYILFSSSLNRFYIGQTNNLEERLKCHNMGLVLTTKRGVPWIVEYSVKVENRSIAVLLEKKIKKRGAKRYLQEIKVRGVA